MQKEEQTAIIILAAGASTRLGTPKQLLPWGKSTLLENAIDIATETRAGEVIVVTGANEQLIRSNTNRPEAQYVINDDWRSGMGSSISAGIRYLINHSANYENALIMLCDQPQADQKYLGRLIGLHDVKGKGITATSYQNQAGVPAIFNRKYFDALLALSNKGGAKKLIQEHLADVHLIVPDFQLQDIDTREDYERLLALLRP